MTKRTAEEASLVDPPPAYTDVDAAILRGIKTLRVERRKVPPPEPDEVQVAINCVGICGSDMAYWAKGVAGGFLEIDFSEAALCKGYEGRMGHECAGTVRRVGSNVKHLEVGDRVAMEPGVPCGDCADACRMGRYNLCPNVRFIGSAVNKVPGAMCTLFNHKATFCYKLPASVSLEEGAMLEPMCVSLHAVMRSKVRPGFHVLVSGAGPIGLMTALCAKAAGASTVTITDMVDAKLAKAAEIGVEFRCRAHTPDLLSKMEQNIGRRFDCCFECCGVAAALQNCIKAAVSGGTVCVVANFPNSTPVPLQEAARREIDIIGVYRYCNLYPVALSLLATGKVDLKPLISKKFQLNEANEAFEYFATGEPVKVIIQPTPLPES